MSVVVQGTRDENLEHGTFNDTRKQHSL